MKVGLKMGKTVRYLLPLFAVLLLIAGCTDNNQTSGAKEGQSPTGIHGKQPLQNAQMMTLTLYFSTKDASALVAEKREVVKNDHPARTAIEELINGPKKPGLTKVIPATTKLRDLKIKDQVAYVDFSENFVKDHWGGSSGEILTIAAIVNTLTEFPEIKGVQFMVEGKRLETLKGHLDLEEPLVRNEAIIRK